MHKARYTTLLVAAVALAAMMMQRPAIAAENTDREQKLIAVLKSDAPKADKAITCKFLSIYGSKEAVPVVAPLLVDQELSSWARIALEAIPGPEADAALRDAMYKVEGRLLIGVINSIGYRRDAQAVAPLVEELKNRDAEVASAAAAALGKIGGDQAAKALEQFLGAAPEAVRPAAAEGCIVCAERFLADGSAEKATRLYDAVRSSQNAPKQRALEATRGAILARGAAGLPLLLENLRSQDKATFTMALRSARELAGDAVTDAVIAELPKNNPQRQALLLIALGDRGSVRALPAVLEAARNGPAEARIAAAGVLEKLGNASCIPVLLDAAVGNDAAIAQAAKVALARLAGRDVDSDLLTRLRQSSGKMRQTLIELAEQRRIDGSIPVFVELAVDSDAGIRTAAVVAIGAIGEAKDAAGLAGLLRKTTVEADRDALEKAMMSLCGREAAACVPHVLPLVKSDNAADRIVALHVLACCGGPDALTAVKAAVEDQDGAVQDEAVRTLAAWPNRWPGDSAIADPLLALARSGKKPTHQVLALRGYLQFVQDTRTLRPEDKLARVKDVLPLLSRPEEKRLAISVLRAIGTGGAMEPLVAFTADAAVGEEACAAVVGLAGRNTAGLSRQQRQQALQTVMERTKTDATRQRAQELLK